ncbi:unnamed protein product [Cyprideis torosa]|uniref:Uncharacterized protein n=1 Tax=Cyprideis torosa TaxID=163714 RepID=A0A7R8WI69_9CRUS|nr:unnamed protein product [Cyprideis torosa]CAG0900351.1 unnamed protein product [Cyprideis torosa]
MFESTELEYWNSVADEIALIDAVSDHGGGRRRDNQKRVTNFDLVYAFCDACSGNLTGLIVCSHACSGNLTGLIVRSHACSGNLTGLIVCSHACSGNLTGLIVCFHACSGNLTGLIVCSHACSGNLTGLIVCSHACSGNLTGLIVCSHACSGNLTGLIVCSHACSGNLTGLIVCSHACSGNLTGLIVCSHACSGNLTGLIVCLSHSYFVIAESDSPSSLMTSLPPFSGRVLFMGEASVMQLDLLGNIFHSDPGDIKHEVQFFPLATENDASLQPSNTTIPLPSIVFPTWDDFWAVLSRTSVFWRDLVPSDSSTLSAPTIPLQLIQSTFFKTRKITDKVNIR